MLKVAAAPTCKDIQCRSFPVDAARGTAPESSVANSCSVRRGASVVRQGPGLSPPKVRLGCGVQEGIQARELPELRRSTWGEMPNTELVSKGVPPFAADRSGETWTRSCVRPSSKRLRSCMLIRRWLKGASIPRSDVARISSGRSSMVVSMQCSCRFPCPGAADEESMSAGA